jgi:hypothetical protein
MTDYCMRKIDFIYFDAGGGHRSAATALKTVMEQQHRPWQVRLVNLQELLQPLDIFRKLTGIQMEDVYNKLLAKGWTLGSELLIAPMHAIIRMYHPGQVRMLAEFWGRDTPDMVVSVVPNFNRALFQGLRRVSPSVPYVTILTDLADFPPHFWMEKQDQYFICGTDKAVEQARSLGHPENKILRTSGMILRPIFYEPITADRAAGREKLGLHRDTPTGIVLFGGQGSNAMLDIAKRLGNAPNLDVQLILICGRNEKLATRIRALKTRIPLHVVGFTQEIPYFMHLSDFMIGKPGPGSISEAIAMKLPVIVERNAWTLPQERFNTDWLRERKLGIVVHSFKQIADAVSQMLDPENYVPMKARVAAIENRAVFEIPDMLEKLLP